MINIISEIIKIIDEIYPGFENNKHHLDELDSFSLMELMVAIEEKFSIIFEADDFSHKNFSSVEKLADFIEIKLAEKK